MKPAAPPKPKMIIQKPAVDIVAMESNMLGLQRENADLKRQLQEQHDVIINLRRDLTGASAKLSDMTGNDPLNSDMTGNDPLNSGNDPLNSDMTGNDPLNSRYDR